MPVDVEQLLGLIDTDPRIAMVIFDKLRDRFVSQGQFKSGIDELTHSINHRFDKIDNYFDRIENRLDSVEISVKELDRRLGGQIKELDQKVNGVEISVKELDQKVNGVEISVKELDRRLGGQIKELNQKVKHVITGLGINFEGYNKTVLKHFLIAQGVPADKLIWRVHIDDPEGEINPQTKEVEIDLFQERPLIVVEVTSFEDDLVKLRRFIKIVRWLERKYNQKARAYYLTYAFPEDIEDEARELLRRENIILITTKT